MGLSSMAYDDNNQSHNESLPLVCKSWTHHSSYCQLRLQAIVNEPLTQNGGSGVNALGVDVERILNWGRDNIIYY
jgi:hypothetical protein